MPWIHLGNFIESQWCQKINGRKLEEIKTLLNELIPDYMSALGTALRTKQTIQ